MAISESEFMTLAAEEQDKLIGYLRKLCHGDLHRAQDIAQEALIRTWKRIDSIIPPGKSYLFRVAYTCWIDDFRQSEHKPLNHLVTNLDEAEIIRPPCPETMYLLKEESAEISERVANMLALMTPAERAPLLLYAEGWQYPEIAVKLELPLGTVKSRIYSARHAERRLTPGKAGRPPKRQAG